MESSISSDLKVIVYSKALYQSDEDTTMRSDLLLLIGSLIMLFITQTYWLESVKLGILTLLIQILCITSSMCLSHGLFGVTYSTYESLLIEGMVSIAISTIYIILISDAWNQSSLFVSFQIDEKGGRYTIPEMHQRRAAYVWER